MKHRLAPLDVVSADAEDSSYSSAGRGGRLRVEGRDVGGMSGATTTDSEFETNKVQISSPTTSSTKSWKNFTTRSIMSVIMIFTFLFILMAGYRYVLLLVLCLQTFIFKEAISIAHIPSKENQIPWFRSITWYFLFTITYFLYGESLIYYLRHIFLVDAFLLPLATHHRFISFCLYTFGLVLFVMNLRKGFYKFQFSQFAWTHMTLLLVTCQAFFIINNIFEGLFWFIIQVALVIFNDIAAYICGFFFGRTSLIKISPKKTWEGFLGAFISTCIFSFILGGILAQYPYLTCPVKDWSVSAFDEVQVSCVMNPVFITSQFPFPPFISGLLKHLTGRSIKGIHVFPVQWHCLIMGIFASLIAPFGGFFASGVKRAFKIKDFSDSIPGHGGATDRFDCQFLMGVFVYMYITSFVKTKETRLADVLSLAIHGLEPSDLLQLYQSLQEHLINQHILQ